MRDEAACLQCLLTTLLRSALIFCVACKPQA